MRGMDRSGSDLLSRSAWLRLSLAGGLLLLVALSWLYFDSWSEQCSSTRPCDGMANFDVYLAGFYTAIIGGPPALVMLSTASPGSRRAQRQVATTVLGPAALLHGVIAILAIWVSATSRNGDLSTLVAVVSTACALGFSAAVIAMSGPARHESPD